MQRILGKPKAITILLFSLTGILTAVLLALIRPFRTSIKTCLKP